MRTLAPAQAIFRRPFLIVLVPLLLTGLFTFRHYGLSWDEPLFYAYGDALGYAYQPSSWFSGDFDLSRSYGPSGTDHRNRGPAYLVLGRGPAHVLESLGLQQAEAWHLINFLTFLAGVYFLYCLCRRWMSTVAALFAAALFALQPLLWGHAFINPKDIPFLVFFLGAFWLGLAMVDAMVAPGTRPLWTVLCAAAFLGAATSMRVLGPLAGILVAIHWLLRGPTRRSLTWMVLYAVAAFLAMLATWPYLWEAPWARFFEVLHFMSENPTGLMVLFGGQYYRAYELPRRYLPFFLAFSLTEPVWPLFAAGLLSGVFRSIRRGLEWRSLSLILSWFLLVFLYVILVRPPMYDGMRHFLFMLPPVFVFAGLGMEALLGLLTKKQWLTILVALALLAPGVGAAIQLHPYEYAYYNAFIGGTGGAFRSYETEYWLTCYKQAVQDWLKIAAAQPGKLYVHREAYIAATYAPDGFQVLEERGAFGVIESGDYILVNTRSNEDLKTFRGAPVMLRVGRSGAVFCVIKRIP